MSDKPEKEEVEEMDEIDRFLATLPSLHIPDDMVEDTALPPQTGRVGKQVPLTSIFALLAWFVLVFALLTASRAASSQGWTFFGSLLNESSYSAANPQYLFTAMCYLLGNCAVCAGGLGICFIKKMKMTGGSAMNFWIAGGLSAIIAVLFFIAQ
ncbi:MAG: hypothetical protein LBI19_03285 [Oscillospiraceae bacterium]|jgi:hypothetical protein|nr:hypothetical protein [Oscillospiraceae bacterium]